MYFKSCFITNYLFFEKKRLFWINLVFFVFLAKTNSLQHFNIYTFHFLLTYGHSTGIAVLYCIFPEWCCARRLTAAASFQRAAIHVVPGTDTGRRSAGKAVQAGAGCEAVMAAGWGDRFQSWRLIQVRIILIKFTLLDI